MTLPGFDIPLPALETPRLYLRSAGVADLGFLQALWNEPLVRRYLFDDSPVDEAIAAKVLSTSFAHRASGCGMWVLERRPARECVGCAALLPTAMVAEQEPRVAGMIEPMLALTPAHWHRGYAAEALAALLQYAFGTLKLREIAAANDVPNVASERMLLGAGFSPLSEVSGPRYPIRTYTLSLQRWKER